MLEINFDNPILEKAFFCRRLVLQDGVDESSLDQNWIGKLNRGAGGRRDLVLRNSRTQVPKGFKVVEEVKNGQVLATDMNANRQAVHVCSKSEATGFIKGMSVKWIPIDEKSDSGL